MKKIPVLLSLVVLFLSSLAQVQAQAEELIVNFILPPASQVKVFRGGEVSEIVNESDEYQKNVVVSNSDILVDGDYFGARVAMSSYYIYFRPFSKLKVESALELDQGSVWVKVLKGGDDFSISLGSLSLESSEGEFLLYISPEHDDLAVKVLDGNVSVLHEKTGHRISLLF